MEFFLFMAKQTECCLILLLKRYLRNKTSNNPVKIITACRRFKMTDKETPSPNSSATPYHFLSMLVSFMTYPGQRYHKRVADRGMDHLAEVGRYHGEYRKWLNPVHQSRCACSWEELEHLGGKRLIGEYKKAGHSWRRAGQASGQMHLDPKLFQGCPPSNPNPR